MMPDESCLFEYRMLFPKDKCFFSEPGPGIIIMTGKSIFVSPVTETKEIFLTRLTRCKNENKNLFYQEWEEYDYDSGFLY